MNSLEYLCRGKSALTLAGVACIGLAGCCTKRYQSAYYQNSRPTYYSSTTSTREQAPTPTGREYASSTTSGNIVVPLYQESLNVGKREVEAGSVRLRKIVKTETVNQPVELRHEEVVIDREPAGQAGQNQILSQPFQEGETVIRLKQEVPVIEKQTSPAGQIVVQTRSAAEQTNVQAEVRREDIDIVKHGNAQNVIIGQNVHASVNEATGAAETSGGQTTGAAASVSAGGTITDPATLTTSADASSLTGRQVQLSGLKVRRTIGDRCLVLGAGQGQHIFVVNDDQTANPKTGDIVNVTGSIKAGGSDAGVSGEASQELASKPFFVDAQKIEITNK